MGTGQQRTRLDYATLPSCPHILSASKVWNGPVLGEAGREAGKSRGPGSQDRGEFSP